MSHDRTPLQSEMRACLREELELRRQVSQIKSEPLWWKMATIKVFSRLQERDFNAHGLLVKADELGARAQRFQAMGVDEEEIKRRESLVNKIRIYNKFYTMDHKKILDSLEISEEQMKSVKQVPVKSEVESFLEVELDSSDTVNKVMARKSRLMQAPVEWMRKTQIFRVRTCLEKYIDELLREEMRIRNMIASLDRQPTEWYIRNGRVQYRDL